MLDPLWATSSFWALAIEVVQAERLVEVPHGQSARARRAGRAAAVRFNGPLGVVPRSTTRPARPAKRGLRRGTREQVDGPIEPETALCGAPESGSAGEGHDEDRARQSDRLLWLPVSTLRALGWPSTPGTSKKLTSSAAHRGHWKSGKPAGEGGSGPAQTSARRQGPLGAGHPKGDLGTAPLEEPESDCEVVAAEKPTTAETRGSRPGLTTEQSRLGLASSRGVPQGEQSLLGTGKEILLEGLGDLVVRVHGEAVGQQGQGGPVGPGHSNSVHRRRTP